MANEKTTLGNDELALLMQYRSRMYGFLSRIFEREVDDAFLAQLREMHYPQGTGNPAFDESFRSLYAFMRTSREDVLDVLAVDYARTFLGGGILNGNAAFPYESVYTSEHALIMQEARDEVLDTYRRNSYCIPSEWTDPEDHIAIELAYMRVLCDRTNQVIAKSEGTDAVSLVGMQYSFLTLHLLRWVQNFCTDVDRFSSTTFYKAVARLAVAFLEDDKTTLEDIAQTSGIDLDRATVEARAADQAISDAMAEEAAKDHLEPNVVVKMENGHVASIEPLSAKGEEPC